MKDFKITNEEKKNDSSIIFDIEVATPVVEKEYEKVRKNLSLSADLAGFRKGKVPEKIFEEKIGKMAILEHTAEDLIEKIIREIVGEKKLNVVTYPKITITTIAPENPLLFKAEFELMPEIALPDYKSIAEKINNKKSDAIEVTEKEIDDSIEQIRKLSARQSPTPDKLPELTDEFVKKISGIENISKFKDKLRLDLLEEKKRESREKKRMEIADGIVALINVDLPKTLVSRELDRMESNFEGDIERMGLKKETYMEKIKKSSDDLRKEWRETAEKRVKMDIAIAKISIAENISAPQEEIEHETKHLIEHYKDADKNAVRSYVERMLITQKVFDFLENLKNSN